MEIENCNNSIECLQGLISTVRGSTTLLLEGGMDGESLAVSIKHYEYAQSYYFMCSRVEV